MKVVLFRRVMLSLRKSMTHSIACIVTSIFVLILSLHVHILLEVESELPAERRDSLRLISSKAERISIPFRMSTYRDMQTSSIKSDADGSADSYGRMFLLDNVRRPILSPHCCSCVHVSASRFSLRWNG